MAGVGVVPCIENKHRVPANWKVKVVKAEVIPVTNAIFVDIHSTVRKRRADGSGLARDSQAVNRSPMDVGAVNVGILNMRQLYCERGRPYSVCVQGLDRNAFALHLAKGHLGCIKIPNHRVRDPAISDKRLADKHLTVLNYKRRGRYPVD